MVYVSFIRSTYAHANIKRMDLEKCESVPYVVGTLGGEAFRESLSAVHGEPDYMYFYLPAKRTRFVGEPIAAILASNRHYLEDALELSSNRIRTPRALDGFAALFKNVEPRDSR